MELDKNKVWDWFAHLTVKRLAISALAGALTIAGWTLWENRQKVFESQSIRYNGDYVLEKPSEKGQAIVSVFHKSRPEIVMITLLDANPVSNRREVVYRWFSDTATKTAVETQTSMNPTIGDGALFSQDPENNKQVLAVLSGEFYCAPAAGGIINIAFPDVAKRVKFSCRVPLPPAFGKATGWFTIHLTKWPLDDIDRFKTEALTMSLTYFNSEILKQPVRMIQ